MLTKDMLRYTIRRGRVYPGRLDRNDETLLKLAADLIGVYEEGLRCRLSREVIEERVANIIHASTVHVTTSKGLAKLLADRAEYAGNTSEDFAEQRLCLLKQAAAFYRHGLPELCRDFRKKLLKGREHLKQLYADLPAHHQLAKFPKLYPSQLLDRYNLAQVQGILLGARSLDIVLTDPEPAQLRRLLRWLKFCRLLVRLRQPAPDRVELEITGPLDIIRSGKSYGLQLAMFFPAVCLCPRWQLMAEVTLKRKQAVLKLDETAGLVSHYHHFSAYIPEEVKAFAASFKAKAPEETEGWMLSDRFVVTARADNELVFPDFLFEQPATGKQVCLELFHRWHYGVLTQRLEDLQAGHCPNYVLGIESSLKTTELQGLISGDKILASHCFFFREYPSVNKVIEALGKVQVHLSAETAEGQTLL
ncbi:MAG: DUF790 family protein [Lentisphaerae bacterium]|nr:MAG: DUF790 family protein [Lentisphaerota bacterium]